jgi:S-adenosylmethionine synthetase
VEAGLTNNAKVELAYMIGVPDPVAINVQLDFNCHLTEKIKEFFVKYVDMTPWGIKTRFNLTDVNYFNLARQGHFGDPLLPWEKADLYQELYEYVYND